MAFGALTLIFTVITLGVVYRQLQLMREQTRLMEKQDVLLGRSSKLEVKARTGRSGNIVFSIFNAGSRSAASCYFVVNVPNLLRGDNYSGCDFLADVKQQRVAALGNADGTAVYRCDGFMTVPVYPQQFIDLLQIPLNIEPDSKQQIIWELSAEDGLASGVIAANMIR